MVNASLNINWSDHFGYCIAKLRGTTLMAQHLRETPAHIHQEAGAECP